MDATALAAHFDTHHTEVVNALTRASETAAVQAAKVSAIEQKTDALTMELTNMHQKQARIGGGSFVSGGPITPAEEFVRSEELQRFKQIRSHPTLTASPEAAWCWQ